jgi:hypothetical protein
MKKMKKESNQKSWLATLIDYASHPNRYVFGFKDL